MLLLLTFLLVTEYVSRSAGSQQNNYEEAIQKSLNEATFLFDQINQNLEQVSTEIQGIIERAVQSEQNRLAIFNRISSYDLWGLSISRNGSRWLWSGYDLQRSQIPAPTQTGTSVSIVNLNNVTILLRQKTFVSGSDTYTINSAKKLSQTTDLPFIRNVEYQLSDEAQLQGNFPVVFNFWGTVPEGAFYRKLSTADNDSAGTVYTTITFSDSYTANRGANLAIWRLFFQLSLLFTFFLFLMVWAAKLKSIKIYLLQLLLIFLIWPAILLSGILDSWVQLIIHRIPDLPPQLAGQLAAYSANAFFLFALFICLFHLLGASQKPLRNDRHFRTFSFAALFGALNVLLLLFFIISTKNLLVNTNIPLLDLELAPDIKSFIFYIISGLFLAAVSGILISSGYYLNKSEEDKPAFINIISVFSFILIYFVADLLITDENLYFGWIFSLSSLLLLLHLAVIHYLHKNPDSLRIMSGFRKLMLAVLVITTSVYFIIWNCTNDRMDKELLAHLSEFTDDEVQNTGDILIQLLTDIEEDMLLLSADDVETQTQLVTSLFQRTVQNNIKNEWRNHSFHIKLLLPDNTELATYSTTLETPAWSERIYNVDTMLRSYRGERLRQQTNQPVIWGRPSISERYTALDRGWIPIYDYDEIGSIILWVAGDVFKERLDYNKPMRAVLSAATSSDWRQSFYLAEFMGERLTRSSVQGIYRNQPQYNRLPEREAEIASQDSISFFNNITSDGTFREVLVRKDNRQIIKASTPVPGFNHHLFSYFRLQIVLVFFGLFCFSVLAMAGFQNFSLFGQNRRFKDRLVDGLTLATILLLTVLIFATQYAVGIQNERNVERELVNTLSGVAESLKERNVFAENVQTADLLSEITTPLSVDLVLYRGHRVDVSTTPQIFQQYLMPATLPFPVYDFLFNRERTHYVSTSLIGTNELLIGYRSIPDSDGRPAGAIAIPTFIQSPIYNEQLLETTSYLFVVYLFIFAMFIMGSVFLSNQLTKPLNLIQAGLSKISRGDMKTKVAVTSRDEIGSLANAYNTMVQRLDHAQKELMKAERESAWKEMAQQVAHEIKNPLTPMKLNLQHLQRQLEANPDEADSLRPLIEKTASNIIEQIESLNKIASDFSKFAKPIEEPKVPVALMELLNSIVQLYEHEESAMVSLTSPQKEISVPAVEDELRRVFINLIKNAIEAADGGVVKVHITLKKLREHAMIQIRDDGSGIEDENREKIFLPKFSTKSSGTGLGLAIAKKIIEEHNGDIWFESKKGQGTSFYIRLPLV
ncbi:MAG: HAMP domain-containing histidine kinase [Balneolaceae bacterium]|nr:HAMP domain-containing histidine kinase [Balneolaceae bacterium]